MKNLRTTFRVIFFALLVFLLAMLSLAQLLNADGVLDMAVNGLTLLILAILIYSVAHHSSSADALAKELENKEKMSKPKTKKDTSGVAISGITNILSKQLKEPLTAILGHTTLLKKGTYGKLPEKALEPIETIDTSAMHIAELADDMLMLSHIESGTVTYDASTFSLKVLGAKIVDEERSQTIKKGLLLLFRSDTETDMLVAADMGKVKSAIYSLLDNAIKYSQKGEVTVVAHDDKKTKKAYISVKDTGIGMSPDTLALVFEKFTRAKNANDVSSTGTGLGLYIAKRTIEAMGGKIKATSKGEGNGSLFTIELPLAK